LGHGFSVAGVQGLGRNGVEGNEDEGPLGKTRMRNLQSRLTDLDAAKEQNVQIKCARTVGKAGGAVAAEFLFDAQQAIQQGVRVEIGYQGHDGVDKARLRGKAHRPGGVEGRLGGDAAQGLEALGRGGQRGIRRAGVAGLVATYTYIYRLLHRFQSIAAGGCRISYRESILETLGGLHVCHHGNYRQCRR
jgi:hypothetical protein